MISEAPPYPAETSARLPSPLVLTSHGRAWVLEGAHQIPAAIQQQSFTHAAKDFAFYALIETALAGQFDFRYFILEHAASGSCVVQPFFFVQQDIVAGLPAKLTSWVTALRRRWPRLLTLRMLMVGCAAGEGHLSTQSPWLGKALYEALAAFAPRCGASMVLVKDVPAEYRAALKVFSAQGYQRVPSMPGAYLPLEFANFEDFMQRKLSKVYRKSLRRKFKMLAEAAPLELEVITNATPYVEEIHALYLQTHLRSPLRFEQLTPAYFAGMGATMRGKAHFFLWRQAGKLVAFSLCLVHEGTLYDLDVGLDYRVALDLHLYFVTLRDVLNWAVNHGCKRYYTGPLNYDPKFHLHMQLAPLDLYARHLTSWINPIFKLALHFLEPTRHDKTIRKFFNAHELN